MHTDGNEEVVRKKLRRLRDDSDRYSLIFNEQKSERERERERESEREI